MRHAVRTFPAAAGTAAEKPARGRSKGDMGTPDRAREVHEACPFPECHLGLEHDGDHQIGRPPQPRGELREVQQFVGVMQNSPRCDLEPLPRQHDRALGLYMDEIGFGWALCFGCLRRKQENDAVARYVAIENSAETLKTQDTHAAGTAPAQRPRNQAAQESRLKREREAR